MAKPELVLYTNDHPEANGRKPLPADVAYEMRLPLADGRELVLHFGSVTYDVLGNFLIDLLSERPSYNDGSTNISA